MTTYANVEIISIYPSPAPFAHDLLEIWNQSIGERFQASARLLEETLQPRHTFSRSGHVALLAGEPIGFVLASHSSVESGSHIDALAVLPAHRTQGVGQLLLAREEAAAGLKAAGTTIGGGPCSLLPGVPDLSSAELFFARCGYRTQPERVALLSSDLSTYTPPEDVEVVGGAIRPAQPGQEAQLLQLLGEFPPSWQEALRRHLQCNGRISDYMLLWTDSGLDGFCRLVFEDSIEPIERCFPYRLPRLWGQAGPIGVRERARDRGYCRALADAGLRRLHSNGVNGCVVGPTRGGPFWADFGFGPYSAFGVMHKADAAVTPR